MNGYSPAVASTPPTMRVAAEVMPLFKQAFAFVGLAVGGAFVGADGVGAVGGDVDGDAVIFVGETDGDADGATVVQTSAMPVTEHTHDT